VISHKVKKARHALSLDDERDAFQPLLWDEHAEKQFLDNGMVDKDRLKQVWFSGVHSDVGGGYPDESLSYIPLLWMMDELAPKNSKEALFLYDFVQRASNLANPYGPIHDSRAGLASYYRYQPRKIAAMLDPAKSRYIALRDPAIGGSDPGRPWVRKRLLALIRLMKRSNRRPRLIRQLLQLLARSSGSSGPMPAIPRTIARAMFELLGIPEPMRLRAWRGHGLLKRVRIHESAIARIMSGIDSYAPSALPAKFKIVSVKGPRARAALTEEDYRALEQASTLRDERFKQQERAWNLVWARRGVYFATVGVSIFLLLLPLIGGFEGIEALCGDDRCFARTLLEKPSFLLPAWAEPYWALYLAKPFTLIFGAVVLLALMASGKAIERSFRNQVRKIWKETIGNKLVAIGGNSTGQSIRESRLYQIALFDLKWRFLPGILGIATLAALIILASLAVTQVVYALGEKGELFCKNRPATALLPTKPIRFLTSNSCQDLEAHVLADHRYSIRMTKVTGWADGANASAFPWRGDGYPATPVNGVEYPSRAMSWTLPFARVTSANFMEPLTEVRTHDQSGIWGFLRKWLLGPDIDIRTTQFIRKGDAYEMNFCPTRSGDLYLMVNDVGLLYGNNGGSADVKVTDLGKHEAGSAC
jgi:T6SS, Phospholipase effector Tle1-like, catalytic domain